MSIYRQELANRMQHNSEIRNIYETKQRDMQTSYNSAYKALESGGGIDGLDAGARDMYFSIDAEIKKMQREEAERLKKEREGMNWLERTGHTLGDFFGNAVGGIMKFGENIVDGAATMFGADEDWIKRDWTGELLLDPLAKATTGSYMNDGKAGELVRSTINSVGNMLPSVALMAIPGAGTVLSTGSFMANAAGGSMESSLQDGANRGQAVGYGLLSGATEGLIEKMSGGIGGIGKGVAQNVGKKLGMNAAKSTVKKGALGTARKFATGMIGEGLEEVASDLIDPIYRSIYTGKVDYSDVTAGSLLDTFTVGALAGGVMQGGHAAVRKASPTMDVRARLGELAETKSDIDAMYNKGKLSEGQYAQAMDDINWLANKAVTRLNKLSDTRQNKVLNNIAFVPKGIDKGMDSEAASARRQSAAIDTLSRYGIDKTADGFAVNEVGSLEYNYKAMTPSLIHEKDKLVFKPTNNELTEEQNEIIKEHGKLFNGGTKIVFTDDIGAVNDKGEKLNANGAYKDGIIYISSKSSQPLKEILRHEFTHSLEGTKEYSKYASYVLNEIKNSKTLTKQFGDVGEMAESLSKTYSEVLGGKASKVNAEIISEVVAKYSERLLIDPKAIDRLARANKSLAARTLSWITDKLRALSSLRKSNSNLSVEKFLKNAESLYRAAIRKQETAVSSGNIINTAYTDKDNSNGIVSNGSDVKAAEDNSKKASINPANSESGTIKYKISPNKMKELVEQIRNFAPITLKAGDKTIVAQFDRFTARKNIYTKGNSSDKGYFEKLKNIDKLPEYIKESKYLRTSEEIGKTIDAHKGVKEWHYFINNITTKNGKTFDIVINIRDKGQEQYVYEIAFKNKKEVSHDTGYNNNLALHRETSTTNISNSVNKVNGIDVKSPKNSTKTKFSITNVDSSGRELSEKQNEFFKNSNVRDEAGNLKAVYHGTGAVFNIFDITKSRSWDEVIDYDLPGFYFSESREESGSFGKDRAYYVNITNPWSGNVYELAKEQGSYRKAYDYLQSRGYDGVIIDEMGKGFYEYIAFSPNQIKLIDNETPSLNEDIRFSLDFNNLQSESKLSAEQRETVKRALKAVNEESVAKRHIASAINTLRFEHDGKKYRAKYDEKYFDVSIGMLKSALKGLQYNSTIKLNELSQHILSAVTLYDAVSQEILTKYDSKELVKINKLISRVMREKIKISGSLKGYESELLDKYCSERGELTLTEVVRELYKAGIKLSGRTLVDKIRNFDKLSVSIMNSRQSIKAAEILDNKEIRRYKRVIANRLLKNIDKTGALTAIADSRRAIEQAAIRSREAELKAKAREVKAREAEKQSIEREKMEAPIIQIIEITKKFKEYENKKYRNGSILAMPDMDSIIKAFETISWTRGLRSKSIIHDALKQLQGFIQANKSSEEVIVGFSQDIVDKIDYLTEVTAKDTKSTKSDEIVTEKGAKSSKPSKIDTYRQVVDLLKVVKAVDYLFNHYHAVIIDGVKQDASVLAAEAIDNLMFTDNYNTGRRRFEMKALSQIVDARTLITMVSGAFDSKNALMKCFDELTRGETNAAYQTIELMSGAEEFINKNKQYKNDLYDRKITLGNNSIELGQAIMLYMQSKQYGVTERIAKTGISGMDAKGKRINIKSVTKEDIELIKQQFTKKDLELITKFEETFAEAGKVKQDADIALNGYSDIKEGGYYVPLVVEDSVLAKSYASASQWADDWNEREYGFNKHRNRMANKQLKAVNIYDEAYRHCSQLGIYAHLTQAIRNFDQIMNYNINLGNKESKEVITLKDSIRKNVYDGFDKYLVNLLQDLQGASRQKKSAIIQWLRNNWIKSVLGLNIKSYASQLAGIPMAGVYLKLPHLLKGVMTPMKAKEYRDYSKYAAVRSHERAAARAKGLEGKLGVVGNLATKPIQMVDNLMMRQFMSAAKSQIEDKIGHEIRTEADKAAVAELFEKIARDTQSNDLTSEKSGLSRHESDLMRSFAIFTGDSTKMLSNIVRTSHMIRAAKAYLEAHPDSAEGKTAINNARKLLRRSVSGMIVSNMMYVSIGLLFSLLLDRKDKDGNTPNYGIEFGKEFFSSLIGLFPIVRDLAGYVIDGYKLDNFAYSMVNDLLDGSMGIIDLAAGAISGKPITTQQAVNSTRKFVIALSNSLGLPFKNLEKYTTGIIKRISPTTTYTYESAIWGTKKRDLDKAIDGGNDKLAKEVMRVMFLRNKGSDLSEGAIETLFTLYKSGNMDMPKSLPNKLTWTDKDGKEQEKELTAKEREQLKAAYERAAKELDALIKTASFKAMDAETQGRTVKRLYDIQYSMAKSEVSGTTDISNAKYQVSYGLLGSNGVALMSNIDAIKNTKQSSRKAQINKMLNEYGLSYYDKQIILAALGYKPISEYALKTAIANSKFNKDLKSYLFEKLENI